MVKGGKRVSVAFRYHLVLALLLLHISGSAALDPASDPTAWRKAGFGIMLDDLVAAGCTVLVVAAWRFFE